MLEQPQPKSFPALRSNRALNWIVAAAIALAVGATAVDSLIDDERADARLAVALVER